MKNFASVSLSLIVICVINFVVSLIGLDTTNEPYMIYVYAGCALTGGIIGSFIKLSDNLKQTINRIIRFNVAFMICMYGFAKIFKTQFTVNPVIYETPIGDLSGHMLTWFYFGYSYTFALIIAIGQIGGSVLLLFERTRLLGTTILLPIMLNIVFVNLFYDIAIGALLNSLIFTICLVYLLFLNYEDLKKVFLPPPTKQHNKLKTILIKNLFRVIPIMLGFFFILFIFLVFDLNKEPPIKGTFEMVKIVKNDIQENPFLTDSVLTKIFFHKREGRAEIEFNSPERRHQASYRFDNTTNSITLKIEKDSVYGSLDDELKLELEGIIENDTYNILLQRKR